MSSAILVFAKAPVPGFAKTRLIPALGAEGAATLQQKMTTSMVREALNSGIGEVTLCCTPNTQHPLFSRLVRESEESGSLLRLTLQQGEDLGERMAHALTEALIDHRAAILVGTDCPALNREHLQRAQAALLEYEAVLIPATDGGYLLIALQQSLSKVAAQLFEGVEWGGSRVMEQTSQRLKRLQIDYHLLEPLTDIDEAEDLSSLPADFLETAP